MYSLMVKRDFIASHFLIGGEWGEENSPHNHHYVLELELTGTALDQHNYLIDIVKLNSHLDETIALYKNKLINETPDFKNTNPSLELFARILCLKLRAKITEKNIAALSLRLWENQEAWASFSLDLERA